MKVADLNKNYDATDYDDDTKMPQFTEAGCSGFGVLKRNGQSFDCSRTLPNLSTTCFYDADVTALHNVFNDAYVFIVNNPGGDGSGAVPYVDPKVFDAYYLKDTANCDSVDIEEKDSDKHSDVNRWDRFAWIWFSKNRVQELSEVLQTTSIY